MSVCSVQVLGSGSSRGVPEQTCKCPVCVSKDTKDKRLRPSLLFHLPNQNDVILNCGNDFRTQALRAHVMKLSGVIISSTLPEAFYGIDDLRVFSREHGFPIYGNQQAIDNLTTVFDYAFNNQKTVLLRPHLDPIIISEKTHIFDVDVTPINQGFLIGKFLYLQEAKYDDSYPPDLDIQEIMINCTGADMSIPKAIDVIASLHPVKAYITRIDHTTSQADAEKCVAAEVQKRGIQIPIFVAFDGLEFDIHI